MEQEFESMSKAQLESHGRTVGIELDRRLVKSQLVAQLQEFITLKKIEEEMDVEDTDLDFIAQVLEEGLPHGGPDNDPVIRILVPLSISQ